MRSSVPKDVILCHKTLENIPLIINMNFHENRFVRSRYIDVLVSMGNRVLNQNKLLIYTRIIYFQNQTVMLIRKIYFVFRSEKNKENLNNKKI